MEQASGLILIFQKGYFSIHESSALAALPEPLQRCPRHRVEIDLSGESEFARYVHDWHGASGILQRNYRDKLKPLLDAYPEYTVAYFGSTPISLAAQLGFLLGTWRPVLVYQHHHQQKDWRWGEYPRSAKPVKVVVEGLPERGSQAEGEVVVRVSTSHRIDQSTTRKVVGHPLAEVDVCTEELNEDVLASPADLAAVASAFKDTIDAVHRLYPHLKMIHLFAACPVGLAMMLGKQVGARIHPMVHTYEFDAKTDPQYNPSLILQIEEGQRFVPTDSEREEAKLERSIWVEELGKLQTWVRTLPSATPGGWLDDVLPPAARPTFDGKWTHLARIAALRSLTKSHIDLSPNESEREFRFNGETSAWILPDDFLVPLKRQLSGLEERRRAIRLFLFHESIHEAQILTASTSTDIGRFPKVLEEIDYRADVWAFLHERRYSLFLAPGSQVDERQFLQKLIKLHLEVMNSFEASSAPLSRIQIRRTSRYLIWAWHFLHAEKFTADGSVWGILAEKPLLEIFGPKIITVLDRIFYLLDPRFNSPMEMGICWKGQLVRIPDGPAYPMGKVLDAFRTLNTDGLLNSLRGFFELTSRH